MATAPENPTSWKKRETFSSALVQIGIVGVVLALAVTLVYRRGSTKKEMGEAVKAARATSIRGNLSDIKKGIAIAEEALNKDSGHADTLGLLAAQYTDLWLIHGDVSAQAKAKEYLEKAKRADSEKEERYGAEGLHLLAAGNAKQADEFIEGLRKRGANSAKLFYVQAMALKAQGNLQLAKAGFTTAIDKAWKDPQYPSAWGEALLDEGLTGAIDSFNKSLAANPDYVRAKLGLSLARVMKRDRVGDAEAMVAEVLTNEAELSPPLKARALTVQAHLANVASEWDKAIGLADQALAINSTDTWARFAKANALAAKKDPGAPALYTELVGKQPSAPVFYFEGAKNLVAAGAGDAGLALLDAYEAFFKNVKNQTTEGKEVAALERDDRYWLTRGDVLRQLNKLDLAMVAYDKAIDAKNLSVTKAYYAKGALLLAQKEYDKAQAVLQDITPPDGSGQIAEAYVAMGEVMFAKKEYGPACQTFVYGLIRMKAQQVPREQMNVLLTDVEKRLKSANQRELAKVWVTEAKTFIQ